jgi:hypothetical protein
MTTVDLSPAGAARRAVTTRVLLACGAVAGPLFTAAWILEGATRAHYNPLRHPVSSLELGDLGWTQQANFVVAGGLTLAFAVGLWRALRPLGGSTWGPLLVGAHGIGAARRRHLRHRPGQRLPAWNPRPPGSLR